MGNVFAGSEIVEIGIQIEKNGKDFYETLAGKAKNKKAGEIFRHLAEEEARHVATFKKILDGIEKYEAPEAYPGEYVEYMNALAGEYIFTQKDKGREAAEKAGTDRGAVSLGIGFEKDSIIFYEGMKGVVPEYDHKVIDGLIKQEQSHLKKLTELKKGL